MKIMTKICEIIGHSKAMFDFNITTGKRSFLTLAEEILDNERADNNNKLLVIVSS